MYKHFKQAHTYNTGLQCINTSNRHTLTIQDTLQTGTHLQYRTINTSNRHTLTIQDYKHFKQAHTYNTGLHV